MLGDQEGTAGGRGVCRIGCCAYMIRRRRGLSQDVVAGLAGISKQYVSMLEGGNGGLDAAG